MIHSGHRVLNNTVHTSGKFLLQPKPFVGLGATDLDIGFNNLYGANYL